MQKPSSGFSGPAPASAAESSGQDARQGLEWNARPSLWLLATCVLGLLSGEARTSAADESAIASLIVEDDPRASPSASPTAELDPTFLLLPALDVEIAEESQAAAKAGVRVGDGVAMKIEGAPKDQGDLKLATPQGHESLVDQGWGIRPTKGREGALEFRAFPLKQGQLTLPTLAIKNRDGIAVARTNPFNLRVESGIAQEDPKPEEAADTLPMLGLQFPKWVWLAAGGVVLGLLALFVYGIIRLRSRVKPFSLSKIPPAELPEDEEALRALAELETQGLWIRGGHKKHVFRVSEILKRFLGRRYRFDAMECTRRELVDHLMGNLSGVDLLPREKVLEVSDLFERLDQVKFTDWVPGPDESVGFLVGARALIQALRQPTRREGKPGAV